VGYAHSVCSECDFSKCDLESIGFVELGELGESVGPSLLVLSMGGCGKGVSTDTS